MIKASLHYAPPINIQQIAHSIFNRLLINTTEEIQKLSTFTRNTKSWTTSPTPSMTKIGGGWGLKP